MGEIIKKDIIMEKINIAELLKDCPKGMKLYSPIFGEGTLHKVTDRIHVNFQTEHNNKCFDIWGKYSKGGECMLFPSEEDRDWGKFQRPFKDGDIVATTGGTWIGITEGGEKDRFIPTYCVIKSDNTFEAYSDPKEKWTFNRLATEEEKQKLLEAIKDSGYKWNAETKTLEKLIEPKFKVGDKVKRKEVNYTYIVTISEIDEEYYTYVNQNGEPASISIKNQDRWELVPNKFDITTLKPFDKVLVRLNNDNQWYATWFSHIDEIHESYGRDYVTVAGKSYRQMIPYKGNEHLLGKTDDCDEYYKTWE